MANILIIDDDPHILMLTAKGETTHKAKGFELGTDDYLVKPFDPLELIARVKALLKRYRIEMIWGYDYEGDERTIDVHIRRLRERFGSEDHAFQIWTIGGLGYRFEVKP